MNNTQTHSLLYFSLIQSLPKINNPPMLLLEQALRHFIWSQRSVSTVELLKYLESLLYPGLGLSPPSFISVQIFICCPAARRWDRLCVHSPRNRVSLSISHELNILIFYDTYLYNCSLYQVLFSALCMWKFRSAIKRYGKLRKLVYRIFV